MEKEKKFNVGYFLIGLFFPWVGLILFFCYRRKVGSNCFLYGLLCGEFLLPLVLFLPLYLFFTILDDNNIDDTYNDYTDSCSRKCVDGYYDYGDNTCVCPHDSEFNIDGYNFDFPSVDTY